MAFPEVQKGSQHLSFYIVGGFLFILIVIGIFYYRARYFTAEINPSAFTEIMREDQQFSDAVALVQAGDKEGARPILEERLRAAEANGDEEIAGVMKLWLALTYSTVSEDIEKLGSYAKTLTEVATNENYHPRTRSYAYAFLGGLYSRLSTESLLGSSSVLDVIIGNPALKELSVQKADGSSDYRRSMVAILKNGASLRENPFLYSRLASVIVRGIETNQLPNDPESVRKYVEEAVAYIDKAQLVESDLRSVDTIPLYAEYLFLNAQVLGIVKNIHSGKYASIVTDNIDELYATAITVASAGSDGGIEAASRYIYSEYLTKLFQIEQSEGKSVDKSALTKKLDEILLPFSEKASLRSTIMFNSIINAKARAGKNIEIYNTVKRVAQYSPVFESVLKKYNAL
ncbi:hypothetical protein EXS57_03335 [Candidatus Kaiserbacteria bacterium]|nr:hypothetical protein [Candidatus Kaiserbacteria bacterium]